jgi:putative transcriptional regulator
MDIGDNMERLQELRLNSSKSYSDMAKLLKISKTYYWQLENNKRRISYDRAVKIAAIFDLKPDEIFYAEVKK